MSTFALSKGVFAFKRSIKKTTNTRKWEGHKALSQTEKLSLENYYKCWDHTGCSIEHILNATHAKVFEDLVEYVKRVGEEKVKKLLGDVVESDISVACLVTGVNMPDHSILFDNFSNIIKDRISTFVARLHTSDCSNIKSAIFKMITSIMNKEEVIYDSEDENEYFSDAKFSKGKSKNIKKTHCNISILSSWYQENVINNKAEQVSFKPSPSKWLKTPIKSPKIKSKGKKNEKSDIPPIIVIIEEVELVPIKVLEDLLLVCSEYQKQIPFVFIFGVSTTPSYIHRHLSQEASSFIAMEVFQAQPSSFLLSEVIDKTLMNPSLTFGIGGKVFKLLLDTFLFHDLSVNKFVCSLKFCMLEHFIRGEASFLCCGREKRSVLLQEMPSDSLSTLRNLSSFKQLLENDSSIQSMNDDSFREFVVISLNELEEWHTTFCVLVKFLHSFVKSLPGTPLGRQVREVLATCLSHHIIDTEEFENAWKLLSMCAREEFMPRIKESLEILDASKNGNSDISEIHDKIFEFYEKFYTIGTSESEVKLSSPLNIELKPSDRFHLREKLLGQQKLKGKAPFEELRTEFLTSLKKIFATYLKPYYTKPFHEVFFFDSIENVKYQLLGLVRATVTTGLANPQKYLQCECCTSDASKTLSPNLPDLSLCYKLHLECGKLINLYDWLQAFIAVNEDNDFDSIKRKKIEVDEPLQARFIQSVCELQLLGFIKHTKRKTDHVQRLTWGGH